VVEQRFLYFSSSYIKKVSSHKIKGKPDELNSKFRVTYPLVLNALRAREFDVEDILKGSFAETATWCEKLQRQEKVDAVRKKLGNRRQVSCNECENGNALLNLYYLCKKLLQSNRTFRLIKILSNFQSILGLKHHNLEVNISRIKRRF